MSEKPETGKASDDYLRTLENVKKQYEQYLEVSELYKLPTEKGEEQTRNQTPSLEHPLTTNSIHFV